MLHLSACALSAWQRAELSLSDISFSSLDENSFDIKSGKSLVITVRTLFLLCRNAEQKQFSVSYLKHILDYLELVTLKQEEDMKRLGIIKKERSYLKGEGEHVSQLSMMARTMKCDPYS